MLRDLIILTSCFVAIRAAGEFSVLSSPKSLDFKGNDVLRSQDVSEVLYASLGYPISGDSQWSGLTINDPFNLAKTVVVVLVEGTNHISVSSQAKTYEIQGSATEESLCAVSAELETNNVAVCDMDFNQFDEAVLTYRSCFGNDIAPSSLNTESLNPAIIAADKQFLQVIQFIYDATDKLSSLEKSSSFIVFRLSLESIEKAHGEKSPAMVEATKLVAAAVSKLNTAVQKSQKNEALVVAIASKSLPGRAKREIVGPSADNTYNLAEYYNEDYPVIFNIILWFMVTFGLSLLAICYAIGSMDPGRDSIIYRMTSARMKKDN